MSELQAMQVPEHIARRIAERQKGERKSDLASALGTGGPDIPRISTKSSRFRLVEEGVETTIGINLDVIIVGVNPRVSKMYYAKNYDSSQDNVAPDCFSHDGITPHSMVESPISDSCATCPYNELGSKITPSGAKSKKCADQRHLAVVAAADPSKVYKLTVPVSGMKALRTYFKDLANYNISPEEVITTLGFDDEASYPKLTFALKGYVPEKGMSKVDALLDADQTKIAIHVMEAPMAQTKLEAPKQPEPKKLSTPEDDEAAAYEDEPAPAPKKAEPKQEKKKPSVEPVSASAALEAELDDLFDE